MFRLRKKQIPPNHTVLMVEGRLDEITAPELRALAATCGPGARPTIDLQGLTSLDTGGRALLIDFRASGYPIVGGSLYVSQLLEEAMP